VQLEHHRAVLHHELSVQYAQLTTEGKARQAALDELSQGVNERLLQANSLEGLKEEVRESLTAEARRREKAFREVHAELEARLGRTEDIREELLQQTEARWTHAQAKQSALKRQCSEMMHRMRDAISSVLQAQQRDAFLSKLRPEVLSPQPRPCCSPNPPRAGTPVPNAYTAHADTHQRQISSWRGVALDKLIRGACCRLVTLRCTLRSPPRLLSSSRRRSAAPSQRTKSGIRSTRFPSQGEPGVRTAYAH
jgi:hypothetical protein